MEFEGYFSFSESRKARDETLRHGKQKGAQTAENVEVCLTAGAAQFLLQHILHWQQVG